MARKRKNGQGTVRLRSDGRWEGRHIVGYDENGKAKQKSVLANTKAECVEKLKRLREEYTEVAPFKVKPDMRFHDLRHTFATHALTSGVDAKTLSGILGHTKTSFTLDTYTHVTGDMHRKASGIVGEFMSDFVVKG